MAKVEGLDRLKRKLQALPVVARKRISEAMEKGADEIVAMMKSLVPVDTGGLRESIAWTWGTAPKGALTIGKIRGVSGADNIITIYAGDAENFQARWVEFGTAPHTAGGLFAGATIPAIPAQAFFFPAYRANRRKVKSRVTRAINKSAKEVAAGS